MIKAITALQTIGDGYWSNTATVVGVKGFVLSYISEEETFGELLVFFNTTTWNTKKHGLIYTDSLFIAQLRNWLTKLGYNATSIEYSEQGMQGDNCVSLDVDEDFIASYKAKHAEEYAATFAEIYA